MLPGAGGIDPSGPLPIPGTGVGLVPGALGSGSLRGFGLGGTPTGIGFPGKGLPAPRPLGSGPGLEDRAPGSGLGPFSPPGIGAGTIDNELLGEPGAGGRPGAVPFPSDPFFGSMAGRGADPGAVGSGEPIGGLTLGGPLTGIKALGGKGAPAAGPLLSGTAEGSGPPGNGGFGPLSMTGAGAGPIGDGAPGPLSSPGGGVSRSLFAVLLSLLGPIPGEDSAPGGGAMPSFSGGGRPAEGDPGGKGIGGFTPPTGAEPGAGRALLGNGVGPVRELLGTGPVASGRPLVAGLAASPGAPGSGGLGAGDGGMASVPWTSWGGLGGAKPGRTGMPSSFGFAAEGEGSPLPGSLSRLGFSEDVSGVAALTAAAGITPGGAAKGVGAPGTDPGMTSGAVFGGGCLGAAPGAAATTGVGAGTSLFCFNRPTTTTVVSATNELATTRPSLVSRVILPLLHVRVTCPPCVVAPSGDRSPRVVARSPDRATAGDRRSPGVAGDLRSVSVARSGDRATTVCRRRQAFLSLAHDGPRRTAARNLALRARGLFRISSSPAWTGLRVNSSHVVLSRKVCLTRRSSSE